MCSASKEGLDLAIEFRKKHTLGNDPIADIAGFMQLVNADFMILDYQPMLMHLLCVTP